MSKFNLVWNNLPIQGNPNVTSQEAAYQSKLVAGWVGTGFTNYPNPIPVDKNTSTSPNLTDNIVYQFRVNSICSSGGPMPNIGGVVEAIHFTCIDPSLTDTGVTATCTVNLAGTSITKVRFTLRKLVGGSPAPSDPVVLSPTVVARNTTTNIASITASTGVTFSTGYYWETELYTTIRNGGVDSEIISSSPAYLATTCKKVFTTVAPPTCAAVTDLTVTVV